MTDATSGWRIFAKFVLISGMGWLCDFATYCLLNGVAGWSPFWSNFISSYAGVTFVWFASTKTIFRQENSSGTSIYLLVYWLFQLVSILAYSRILEGVVQMLIASGLLAGWVSQAAIVGKILVTPVNLGTNFIFMRFLMTKVGKKNAASH
jgi:putative flippase GtrA